MSEQTPEVKNHEFDGIKEYDNPLPMWWLWTFFLTIIFSFIYYIHYELAGGPNQKQELAEAIKVIEAQQTHATKSAPAESEESLMEAFKDPKTLQLGAQVFAEKCAVCHGKELQGMIGPNLVDNYWLYGKGTRTGIIKAVRSGVLDKGMPAWETVLKKEELYGTVAYIISKKGSQPANPKAPQGEQAN